MKSLVGKVLLLSFDDYKTLTDDEVDFHNCSVRMCYGKTVKKKDYRMDII